LLIVTVWVGSRWAFGYAVATTFFAALTDIELAGTVVGRPFQGGAWPRLACVMPLLSLINVKAAGGTNKHAGRVRMMLVIGMLVNTLSG
jgi:hypothetical protein